MHVDKMTQCVALKAVVILEQFACQSNAVLNSLALFIRCLSAGGYIKLPIDGAV